jgi:thiamine biosynthesis lipoprotein
MSTKTELNKVVFPSIHSTFKQHNIHGQTMGTRYSAIFYAPSSINLAKVHQALQQAVDTVDNQMSPWKKQSDLVRFNKAPVGDWFGIPLEIAVVINEALNVSKLSGGAFNIGVGRLVDNWGFGPSSRDKDSAVPTSELIPAAHDAFELDIDQFRLKRHTPVALDLCGIAKGFGVDELARVLLRFEIADFMVSIDGEVRIGGTKPDEMPWSIGIEKPDQTQRETVLNLEVSDIAIATSGDYRHFRNIGDEQVSHTMDMKNGMPVNNKTTSVTIASEHCLSTDAWATAFLAMERADAVILANQLDIDALIYERYSDGIASYGTGEFASLVN